MKIVIPNYCAPDSFVENVAYTLDLMGHEVITLPRRSNRILNSAVYRLSKDLCHKLRPNQPRYHERWLLDIARNEKPEMILCLTQGVNEEVLAETRKLGVRNRVAWWGDTPSNMKGMDLLSQEWDKIFIKDPHGVDKLQRLGLDACLMHEAMNPHWHRPLAQCSSDETVIAGTFYGYRQALTMHLIKNDIEVGLYGGCLPRWVNPEIKKMHKKMFVVRDEKSRIFGEGLACLNSTAMSEGNSLNCRAFEIAGAEGLQLIEKRDIISECFEPGRDLLVFDSVPELLELISRAKRDIAWAQKIRKSGAERALQEHTYKHRLDYIFKSVR